MIAAVRFRNFKALRAAQVRLAPFNLVLGPNGSGKTSLIQALLRLRSLAALPPIEARQVPEGEGNGPRIEFEFTAPFDAIRVTLACAADERVCNLLVVDHPPEAAAAWTALRARLQSIRAYLLDHYAMAAPARLADGLELASNGGNLAAVLANWQQAHPETFRSVEAEFCRLMPEFNSLRLHPTEAGRVVLAAGLAAKTEVTVEAEDMSQGTLYLLAVLTLAFTPSPPAIVCLEEADRGMHPRTLGEVRDALYRLSYPQDAGLARAPVQVVTTTHSPYLLDQFRDHPEEVIVASKHGNLASFERLSDRGDLLELMRDAHLGDLWYTGILGGVPGP